MCESDPRRFRHFILDRLVNSFPQGVVMIPSADLERVKDLPLAQEWIYARTMPDNPHW